MPRMRYSVEQIINYLREAEVRLSQGTLRTYGADAMHTWNNAAGQVPDRGQARSALSYLNRSSCDNAVRTSLPPRRFPSLAPRTPVTKRGSCFLTFTRRAGIKGGAKRFLGDTQGPIDVFLGVAETDVVALQVHGYLENATLHQLLAVADVEVAIVGE